MLTIQLPIPIVSAAVAKRLGQKCGGGQMHSPDESLRSGPNKKDRSGKTLGDN